MTSNRFLEGSKVYLNPIKEGETSNLVNFMNDEHIRIYGRNCGNIIYEEKMKEKIEEIQKKDEAFGIHKVEDDSIIGDGSVNSIDKYNRSAMLSIIIIGDENRGKGFGQDAIKLLMKHAFINLNLESLYLGTWEYNKPAIHVYEKLGFKMVGKMRNCRRVGNQVFDEVIMDMIADEYFTLYGNIEMRMYGLKK
jgi:RimJ/RimL family protein N-acetyltransferase